ncbi:MAG: CPBP family intramembrane metalloprotease [Deltaproteobacteria bacterium]|nr:CPBP family intramembrane metalloprotease [Deltaproteobacteria bacterium]
MSRVSKNFWTFYALTWLLLALVPLLSAAFGTSMNFDEIARRASDETGVEWTSNLLNMLRLCLAEPGLWLLLLGSSVPSLAALGALALARDHSGWRAFARRFRPLGDGVESLLVALSHYAFLVLGLTLCLLAVFLIREWASPGEYTQAPGLLSWHLLSTLAFAALLDQGAVLEEAGWRGYATPLLQSHLRTPLTAALVVGVAWALWHLPRDVVSGVIERLGLLTYVFLYLPAFTLGTVTASIIASYFMNRIGGSLIPAIMVHGLANDSMGIAGMATIERALTPDHQLTRALPFLAFAILILIVSGRQLGAQPVATHGNSS